MSRFSAIFGLLVTMTLLSGCGKSEMDSQKTSSGSEKKSPAIVQESTQTPIDTVTLSLVQKNGNTIAIELANPDMQPIASVRAWISFPKGRVEITQLKTNPAFTLYAPGESKIDSTNGIVQIGLTKEEPTSDQKIEIATFEAKNTAAGSSGIDFYDFPTHTQVIANWNGTLKEVLHKPETPGLILSAQK